jgi:hypothetical protein
MKKKLVSYTFLISLLTCVSGCKIISGIFKTGMGVGVFLVLIVVAIVIYFFSRMGKNK